MVKTLLYKILIIIITLMSLLFSVNLAFTFISEELWQMRTIYLFWIFYLFGVAPILLIYLDRRINGGERDND